MKSLTHAAQVDLSRRATAHLCRALDLTGLTLGKTGRERTSAAAIDRLTAHLAEPLPDDTDRARAIQSARGELRAAERLWWELALSAEPVAVHVAKRCGGVMPLEDRIQEGMLGLYRAARIFEPDRGNRFSTHARWWVQAQITRAIDQTGRPIRLSSCATYLLHQRRKALDAPDGHALSTAELADRIGTSREQLESVTSALAVGSLDWTVPGTEGDVRFGELLAAESTDLDGELDHDALLRKVHRALAELPAREHRAVCRLLREETLAQTGEAIGVSRERARQLEGEGYIAIAMAVRGGRVPPALAWIEQEAPPDEPAEAEEEIYLERGPAQAELPLLPRPPRPQSTSARLVQLVEAKPGILRSEAARQLGIERIRRLPHPIVAVRAHPTRHKDGTRLYPTGWADFQAVAK